MCDTPRSILGRGPDETLLIESSFGEEGCEDCMDRVPLVPPYLEGTAGCRGVIKEALCGAPLSSCSCCRRLLLLPVFMLQ